VQEGLLDNYIELQPKRTHHYVQCRLIDIQVGMNRIPYPLREAAFYLGVAQMSGEDAEQLLGVPRRRLAERYRWAIEEMQVRLNGH
jgi:DNA-directed RNA polymerase specialized sigma24 family protein